ncbi:BAX inhibitor protein [Ahniella affigens]|uniref:BAX inhibitor protein n=1 Tax=Ahniella affigens TaxID=2021234 RepID=A0A2P1PQG5_9GAMM|nr:Bax inhibitor-1 family protein [Ahniella affigens]AVP97085.1 BAX inhibitor protein [Ahniella affigens]
MSQYQTQTASQALDQPLTNKVLRNAYLLLGMMLGLSALVTAYTISAKVAPLNKWLILLIVIGSPFLVLSMARSALGVPAALLYGALIGYVFGPIVGFYFAAGPQIVLNAFAGTALICGGLSAFAVFSRKDFSFLGGFFFVGSLIVLAAIIANLIFQIPALSLGISAVVVLLSAIGILYFTSQAIHGGETNYVVIAVGLFAEVWSMFLSLLRIFGIFGGDD